MITAILKIFAVVLPWVIELFGKDAKARRADEGFDKAIAENDAAAITRMLSQRYDSVRSKNSCGAGQQGNNQS
jgi:hypothetical protein